MSECDARGRQARLHTIFNAQHAIPFHCGARAPPEVAVVCAELRRAAQAAGRGSDELVPVAAWPDRLLGTQYLFDLVPSTGAPAGHARVVDDARYQLQARAPRLLCFARGLVSAG